MKSEEDGFSVWGNKQITPNQQDVFTADYASPIASSSSLLTHPSSPITHYPSLITQAIRVRGIVQGVGFRPFVHRLARELGLDGWVRNDGEGVEIAVRGEKNAIATLLSRLKTDAPPLAQVDQIAVSEAPATLVENTGFAIRESHGGHARTGVSPDAAICRECIEELLDPADRRYRYPFINCTHCGPRYTIAARLPYDRPNTSMAGFVLCSACRSEYDDPLNRRFHAQPNACPVCGPQLALLDGSGNPIKTEDVVAEALARLKRGEILAVKGLGGFHLMCDARNAAALTALRRRKQREAKPFALMAANPASLAGFAAWDAAEAALLATFERPIVLLRKTATCDACLPLVAPGVAWLGALLPYAPLHYLLFHEDAGRPAGSGWLEEVQTLLLVATSANPGGEPLVTGNDEAYARLAGIADAYLVHDREILVGCDDSVVRSNGEWVMGDEEWGKPIAQRPLPIPHVFIRRARGYTPRAIRLAQAGPAVLACGGWYKNTVCLTRDDLAFVSQHIGDLDNAATCRAMEDAVFHLMDVLEISPQIVAHDLHPDFHSSRFAAAFALERDLPAVAVQHHHAHLAAVLAEHRVTHPVLGLALDGVGLGSDGNAWGGELLRLEGDGFKRLGHLRELRLPGFDRAAREPWRMAASVLFDLGRGAEIEKRYAAFPAVGTVMQMLERDFNAPPTSSCGRLFDAAAGLLGVMPTMAFEGQAAMRLESLATQHGDIEPLADGYVLEAGGTLSFLPLLAVLAEMKDCSRGAALFHATLAEGLAQWVVREARISDAVVLGGGCFLNAILSKKLGNRLREQGLTVLEARQAPPNDGGISLGQAWVARQKS
ncbi:MAG: carbamoyltransferase HypF [Sulfuricellaceae bacterium]